MSFARVSSPVTALILALAACSALAGEPSQDLCAIEPIGASSDPAFLRSVKQACTGEAWTAAVMRLFALPLPQAPLLKLAPDVPEAKAERVTFEVDLFYDIVDPYPPQGAIEKVNALLVRLEQAFEIHSVLITASVDHRERKTDLASEIASHRARRLEVYLRSAGIKPMVGIKLAVAEPSHADDDEGNARDRSVKLQVTVLRAKVER